MGHNEHVQGHDDHTTALGGVVMDLGTVLPNDNISFHANIAYLSYLSSQQRTVPPSVFLPEVRDPALLLLECCWHANVG